MSTTAPPSIDLDSPSPVRLRPISVFQLEPGRWYLGWCCRDCGWVCAMMVDPDCGALLPKRGGNGVVYFICQCCGHDSVQSADDCVLYRRASADWQEPRLSRRVVARPKPARSVHDATVGGARGDAFRATR